MFRFEILEWSKDCGVLLVENRVHDLADGAPAVGVGHEEYAGAAGHDG